MTEKKKPGSACFLQFEFIHESFLLWTVQVCRCMYEGCVYTPACGTCVWNELARQNTSAALATQQLSLLRLHTLNYSDAVCYTATSTNTLFYLPDWTMINTAFVNNPRRRHAGNLSQYSTVTKLLFKLLQFYKALIFLLLLIFVVVWALTTFSEVRWQNSIGISDYIKEFKRTWLHCEIYIILQIEWRE